MEKTKHALLVGPGAEEFAKDNGFEIVSNEELVSPRARRMLEAVLSKSIKASTETGGTTTDQDTKE